MNKYFIVAYLSFIFFLLTLIVFFVEDSKDWHKDRNYWYTQSYRADERNKVLQDSLSRTTFKLQTLEALIKSNGQ